MKKILKNLIAAILALVILVCSVGYESIKVVKSAEYVPSVKVNPFKGGVAVTVSGKKMDISQPSEIKEGDVVETYNEQSTEIMINKDGVMRLAPKSMIVFKKNDNGKYVFDLKKGQLWFDFALSSTLVNVSSGVTVIVPLKGEGDLVYDGEKTVVRVSRNQIGVGIRDGKKDMASYMGIRNANFLNYFLLAQGGQSTVYDQKILGEADTIKRLLYSKLAKELQVGLYDQNSEIQEQWMSQNMGLDKKFEDGFSQDKMADISDRGLTINSLDSMGYQFDKMFSGVKDGLTFSSEKVLNNNVAAIKTQINDCEFLLFTGRNADANVRIDLIKNMVSEELGKGDSYKEEIINLIKEEYASLASVKPSQNLFALKETIFNIILSNINDSDVNDKIFLIRDYINYAFDLAESDQLNAKLSLEKYFDLLKKVMDGNRSKLSSMVAILSDESQNMDSLFLQFPAFYDQNFLSLKKQWEDDYLAVLPKGNSKEEEQQFIISNKINILKQIRTFVMDGKLAVKDARSMVENLITEIKYLQPNKNVGMNDIIAARIADYGLFMRFLTMSGLDNLSGTQIKLKYQKFLADNQEDITIDQMIDVYTNSSSSGKETNLTADGVVTKVKSDFQEIGVKDLNLGDITSVDQRKVDIKSATLSNSVISGVYDWDSKLLYNLSVNGSLVSNNSIKLADISKIISSVENSNKTQEVDNSKNNKVETQEVVQVSRTDMVAKVLLIQKFKAVGVSIAKDGIEIVDKQNGVFKVLSATLAKDNNIVFGFNYQNKENIVSNLIVNTADGLQSSNGVMTAEELANKVETFYHLFDKKQ